MIKRPKNRSPSRFLGQAAKTVRVEGAVVVLACTRCGRESKERLPSEAAAQKMGSYWKQGLASFCKTCDDPKTGRPR